MQFPPGIQQTPPKCKTAEFQYIPKVYGTSSDAVFSLETEEAHEITEAYLCIHQLYWDTGHARNKKQQRRLKQKIDQNELRRILLPE